MAGETIITLCGNLTATPELRYTSAGVPVANFTIAVTPRSFDRQANEWKDGEASFYRCSAWRDLAENIAQTFEKGMRVIATGNLNQRTYENKEGERRTAFEVQVEDIGPSLKFASADVQRRHGGQRQPERGAGATNSAPVDSWGAVPVPGAQGADSWGSDGGAYSDETPW